MAMGWDIIMSPHPSTPYPSGELLTRQWLNPILLDPFEFESDSVNDFQSYKEGARKTKQKLDDLHERLDRHKDKIEERILDPLQTLHWLRQNVGIWHIVVDVYPGWIVRDELLPNNHPKVSWYQTYWDVNGWGEEEKENGLLRIMLSPAAISWLNEVHKWCDEVELANEREMK